MKLNFVNLSPICAAKPYLGGNLSRFTVLTVLDFGKKRSSPFGVRFFT